MSGGFDIYVRERWKRDPLEQRGGKHQVPYDFVAAMGLAGECGEVLELLKKHYRDGKHPGEALKLELGDVLHYLTYIANVYGWTVADLMLANIEKLEARDAAKGK